jgi:PadR family transcriptional regulator, regulatory protein AphA
VSGRGGAARRGGRAAGAASPAEHALLGLLAAAEPGQPAHGYDLARRFGEGHPLGEVIRLEPGMLYHHLKNLDRRGWVDAATQPQPGRPPRRTFRLTAEGRAELDRWLAEPVSHTREIRLEFLLKLYFAGLLDPSRRAVLVREQRAVLGALADSLAAQIAGRAAAPADPGDGIDPSFGVAVLRLRLAQTHAALAWLDAIGGAAAPEP